MDQSKVLQNPNPALLALRGNQGLIAKTIRSKDDTGCIKKVGIRALHTTAKMKGIETSLEVKVPAQGGLIGRATRPSVLLGIWRSLQFHKKQATAASTPSRTETTIFNTHLEVTAATVPESSGDTGVLLRVTAAVSRCPYKAKTVMVISWFIFRRPEVSKASRTTLATATNMESALGLVSETQIWETKLSF